MGEQLRWAEFIGFQWDEKVGGARPFFVIHASDSDRDGSTVFATTLKQLGIPVPRIPEYEPENFVDRWVHKCTTCHINYLEVPRMVKHILDNSYHRYESVRIPVAEPVEYDTRPSEVWTRDIAANILVKDEPRKKVKITLIEPTIEDTQPIDMSEFTKEDIGPTEFKKKMLKEYSFLKG